jgi:hypothetical protein
VNTVPGLPVNDGVVLAGKALILVDDLAQMN